MYTNSSSRELSVRSTLMDEVVTSALQQRRGIGEQSMQDMELASLQSTVGQLGSQGQQVPPQQMQQQQQQQQHLPPALQHQQELANNSRLEVRGTAVSGLRVGYVMPPIHPLLYLLTVWKAIRCTQVCTYFFTIAPGIETIN